MEGTGASGMNTIDIIVSAGFFSGNTMLYQLG